MSIASMRFAGSVGTAAARVFSGAELMIPGCKGRFSALRPLPPSGSLQRIGSAIMSDRNAPDFSSESREHASLPPAPREHGGPGMGLALPTLLTRAGGLAALRLLENQTGAVPRTAGRARDGAQQRL